MPRPGLRSKSQKRKDVRTPGNKNVAHYSRKKPKRAHCAICKRPLQSVPRLRPLEMKNTNRTARRANRPESARYCAKCLQAIIQEKVRNL
jgi:large subunit ribosomal protein L34e